MADDPLPGGIAPPEGFLLLPEPEEAVLNHAGVNIFQPGDPSLDQAVKKTVLKNPESLEDLCILSYLKYLETEVVAYISLTQTKSQLVKGVAKRMLHLLKDDINSKVTGIASSAIREKMVTIILSEKFPSMEYCNMYQSDIKDEGGLDASDDEEMVVSVCPNICCTGAFVQEGMMGIVMCAEVRQLIFTADKVRSRRHIPGTLEFNVPVVLTHLLGATEGKVSQLERLVFSESFVKEELKTDPPKNKKSNLPCLDQSDKQQVFAKNFGMGNIYDTSDRRGIAVDLLILFRDIHPKGLHYNKLTELVLKNNIQCKFYSRANFQFEFLARIGFCCPKLRVFDVFGTDTWADCLIALFFKDAFHSLHRYLYFMENEEDECSEYHPHDTSRYCQFCLDQWHPNQVERPYTNNPVIPLLDSVYNHVLKRYPKRSYCILRNCVRVSDLIQSTESTVFELVRPFRAPTCEKCIAKTKSVSDPLSLDCDTVPSMKTRLRTKRQLEKVPCSSSQFVGTSIESTSLSSSGQYCLKAEKLKEPCSGPGSGERRAGHRRSSRLNKTDSPSTFKPYVEHFRDEDQQDRWTQQCMPEKRPYAISRRSVSKSREILNLIGGQNSLERMDEPGIMTRAMKRKLEGGSCPERLMKKSKSERSPAYIVDRQLRGTCSRRVTKGSGCTEAEKFSLDNSNWGSTSMTNTNTATITTQTEKTVTTYQHWVKQRRERDTKHPPTVCNIGEVAGYKFCDHHDLWFEPESIQYREIEKWPHLNECVNSLEILNIGGSNVLGEFLPFLLLHTPRLKSVGQWLNTMIYGLEILMQLPGYENYQNFQLQEFSYSSDRSYFCDPYIGFVPETPDFKNVRKEMIRFSNKSATKTGHKQRLHAAKRRQIKEDIDLMASTCVNLRKLNLVVHYKLSVMDDSHTQVWLPLLKLTKLVELDLVAMRFENVRALLTVIGGQLERLTVECDEEQGNGSEIVHLARTCPNISSLRILLGDKILRGEMTLHFGQIFFRKLERLVVEGNVHLHGFAFLWGHCQNLKYMKIGLVVSNEIPHTNVLIQDVFTLLFQVNKMMHLEELHIKNLKIRSLAMGIFLLDNLPNLKKASNWFLDLGTEDTAAFKKHLRKLKNQGLQLDFD